VQFAVLSELCSDSTSDTRRGDRKLAIIEAAESLFLEQGYDRTSLAAIIARSGGSLATVYDLFGNKQGLLRAVVERRRDEAMVKIGDVACNLESCAEMLRVFGCRLYDHMTAPTTIAMKRMVIAEALRDPGFGRAFHADIHLSVVREIADAFAEWTCEGRAQIDRPEEAAELYLAIIFMNAPLQAMMAIDLPSVDDSVIHWRLAPFIAWFAIV
jgi:TetR/AcrR family transcriptional regulator, mexJK operon transcriptional repressor